MLLTAVTIISAGILAYEILLTRLLSIIHWHHFAYMVISIALLGYGASGSFLALTQSFWRPRLAGAFAGFAVLFAVTSMACFGLAQRLPFNALELIWDPTAACLSACALRFADHAVLLRGDVHRAGVCVL